MNYSVGCYPSGKTVYSIIDENGDHTTISLDKWVADILQLELPNVHERLQQAYIKVYTEHPHLSRRERGNVIRDRARVTAGMYQETMKRQLGWNQSDLLENL
jgi:hypothetical protein